MATVVIKGTEKTALAGVGTGRFNMTQAKDKVEKMNKRAEKLGIKTRYEVKA